MFHITISGQYVTQQENQEYWLYIVLSLQIEKSKVTL